MTMPLPGPPDYLGAETCGECWEAFTPGWFNRWLHRRRWGHNPTPLYSVSPVLDLHAQNVEAARRYRGYPPAPPASRDPGVR